MPDKTTWDKIETRITAMNERNTKMDDTAALLNWDDNPYQLVKPDGTTKLKDAISVTPNLPKVFAHGVKSDLLGGKWQTTVEGVSGRRAHTIEEFVEDNMAQADEQLLTEQGIPSLFGWLCNHVCVRWAIGAMWFSWVEDGQYKFKIIPVDMRWTPFVRGKWVAPITFRIKEELEEELEVYEKLAKDGRGEYFKPTLTGHPVRNTTTNAATGTEIEVRDYWDHKDNELWVAGKLVFRQPNPVGYPPFNIVVPASGFMLRDRGYLKHEGEDILFLNAGLYKEFARSVSLEQTSGYAGLYPGYEYEVESSDASPSQPPPKIDETLRVKKGERHVPLPRGDINRAGRTAREDISGMISAGSPLAPKDYNTPPSAVLLAGETELIARLQNARKDALGIFKTQLARMMIKQFIQLDAAGAELVIGKEGRRRKYTATKLGNPDQYTITYPLTSLLQVFSKVPVRDSQLELD